MDGGERCGAVSGAVARLDAAARETAVACEAAARAGGALSDEARTLSALADRFRTVPDGGTRAGRAA